MAVLLFCVNLSADVIVQAPGTDFLVFEAEQYSVIEGDEFTTFLEVGPDSGLETDFGSPLLPSDSDVSGTALFDQLGDQNFTDYATYELQFATPGIYTFYMRYSLYAMVDPEEDYANEDSLYLPLELDELPEQDGWFSTGTQGHNDTFEDPPYWEGYFHWGGPYNFSVGGPLEYEVRSGDVGAVLDFNVGTRERGTTVDAFVFSQDPGLLPEDLDELLEEFGGGGPVGPPLLQAGDADQDLDFDQLDLVKVQVAAKYLSGTAATWGEGDWDGAPGGSQGSPPAGNGMFDQLDIIAALANGFYLTGPYAAIAPGGAADDGQTSIGYNPGTGEVYVDAPAGTELTSINIDSAGGIFTGDAAANLGGSFDNDADGNIFKATFGGSFGSLSFGNVAQTGLSQDFVLNDFTVVGSLAGGGALGDVDLIYVPEPSSMILALLSIVGVLAARRRR
jgi:hypothetical protein